MKIRYHIQDKQEYKDKIKKIIMEKVKNETDINLNNLSKIINEAVEIGKEKKIEMDPVPQKNAVNELKKDAQFKEEINKVMEERRLVEEKENAEEARRKAEEEEEAARKKKEEQERIAAATKLQALVRGNKARAEARKAAQERLAAEAEEARLEAEAPEEEEKKLLEKAMDYFDNAVTQENIADDFISIEVKQAGEVEGGKKQAKKPKRKANKTKRAKKSNKKKRKPKRKTLRKIKKIIFR